MNQNTTYSMIIAAGGTGGHIFPALAIAKHFKANGHRVIIVGTGNNLERKIFGQNDIEVKYFKARKIKRRGLMTFFDPMNYQNIYSTFFKPDAELVKFLKDFEPDLVLGMGGYPSFSICSAFNRSDKTVVVIHEQNSKAGLANRYLTLSVAYAVIEGLPGGIGRIIKFFVDDCIFLGNPVRQEIIDTRTLPREFPDNSKKPRILIVGGSQGAHSINNAVPKAMHLLSEKIDLEIRHDTGKADYEEVKKIYEELNINATVSEFINDISEAYGWADLVIARAGALTVSELSAVGLPSILIPYPQATDNHQFYNAKFLVDKKAAEMILDQDLDPDKLAVTVESFLLEKDKLKNASIAAHDETFALATEKISDYCINIMKKRTYGSSQ
ncbi:MAG TPA: undecaprenyldiphospho-muramoylpentapeptide beta-N-acetylglucosaminyltransferase [Gammaproteobacteria bacterium]|nr:undecaprenyldiphospho-muramoylpentapeptide beta-N-acetylglucosaminyltransferase [Gammaproteobacteria bacterium]HJP42523.1 undecaprenyldiphospho-muramoylpentapeptide beta-N-acetylglucosaminyltransferase [Gammaproteobacteria bacterium]